MRSVSFLGKSVWGRAGSGPQWFNCFVNGFVERVRGVCRYLNEPKSIQNKVVLIENYHYVWTPQQKLCATAFSENNVLP